jgi:1-acyl-sn-glycerol-3-phosphate acyltransferase
VSVVQSARHWRTAAAPATGASWCYRLGRRLFQIAFFFCVKPTLINAEVLDEGGCVLACTHLGHLEPACLGVLVRRPIDWMARTEMFRYRLGAAIMRAVGAIPLKRNGVPVKALRTAIGRAKAGRAIGLFPEGGVALGANSVCFGGPIRRGVSFVSMAAQVPIIPAVVLGAENFHRARPWIPFSGNRIWVVLGEPLMPPPFTPGLAAAATRRAQRAELTAELQRRFMKLYAEVRSAHPIDESLIAPAQPMLHER